MIWFWEGLIVNWAVCASWPENSLPGPSWWQTPLCGLSHQARSEHPSQIYISNKVEFSRYLERKSHWFSVSLQLLKLSILELGEGHILSQLSLIYVVVGVKGLGTCNRGILGAVRQTWPLIFALSSSSSVISGLCPSPREEPGGGPISSWNSKSHVPREFKIM